MGRKKIIYLSLSVYVVVLSVARIMGRWSGDTFFIISLPLLLCLAGFCDLILDKLEENK